MIVTLIGKNVIYKTKLPKVTMGNYWITGENGKKLVNIEAKEGKWKVTSNRQTKIVNIQEFPQTNVEKLVKLPENIIEQITLEEYSINFIYVTDLDDNLFVLYCSPAYEGNYTHLKRKASQDILIGQNSTNQIMYKNPLIQENHARIFFSNGKLMLENYDNIFGTFVNNVPVTKKRKLLFNGDVIFIMGLKIIIMGDTIFVNNPFNIVSYNKSAFDIVKYTQQEIELKEDDDNNVELYSQKDYFARAPRITDLIEKETIKIDRPPENQNKEGTPLIYMLGSTLGMGIVMVISTLSTVSGIQEGTASGKRIFFSVFTSIAMLICMILFPVLNARYEKNKKIKNEKTRQERYKKYIDSKIQLIDKIMNKQKEVLYKNYISAEECAQIVINDESRLWERKIEDEDFLKIRIGIGDLPLDINIEYPEIGFTMEDDNLVDILNTIVNKSKMLKNVPITIPLAEKNVAGLIVKNNDRLVEKFLQNLVMQLITLHSYDELKLVFFMKEDKIKRWEHLKTLPHIWDNSKQIRFWADNYSDMQEISRYLEQELINRMQQRDDANYKEFKPYYFIITDNYKKIENLKIITEMLNLKKNIGFGIFCITDNLLELPNECQVFINLDKNKGIMFENEISSENQKEFIFDSSYTFFFEWIGKKLSNIPIKYTASSSELALPTSYTFLEMYDVGKIEQLNILERWRRNDSTISLQAPIGVDSSGMPIMLDIHEKAHGPHGLIAGSTGSGKSEFIITYILSLAINYHPDDVTVILIDYKGGGLAGAFKKRNVKLPHLVGTITNIDKVGLQRSLASIQSELRRRQVLFNEARNQIDEGTIDIYKYQKLYHEGIVEEPIPHLLIICDEFAELKQQQEEFMDELISVARIGRSLGVHLILATQKPAGIVNDQIRSNSKFGICLKVQDREDSMDVIKRPDAAELKRAGQFYMQVGNNEYFTLGQSAWSGAPYIPSDTTKKNVDNSIKFVSNIGAVIKKIDNSKKKNLKAQGEQLTSIVKYMYEIAKQEKISAKPLWMENIPADIFIDKIRNKYKIVSKQNYINPVIGEFDDPYNQRQGVVSLDLSTKGNTVIYGNAESGKETLLSTIVFDTMTNYTADEVQMYLLDFGSEVLKIFKESPVVGDVVFLNDTEKISRLFEIIQKEIKTRIAILSDYGGDYNLYLKTDGNVMPMIVIMINNYEAFSENYENEYDDILLTLTREGLKCGIVFIITASTSSDLRYRLAQNFRQKIVLQLNNEDDYMSILDGVGKKRPSHIFGRGLVRLEDIYEFQTARICEPEKWNTYIKDTIKNLKNNSKVFAKNIPILPSRVQLNDVKEEIKDLTAVPLGISKKNINVATYDFTKKLINIISAKNIEIAVQYMSYILEEFKLINDLEVTILDAERIIQEGKGILSINLKKLELELENNLNKLKPKICVIIGLDKFINDLDGTESKFNEILSKAEELENYNFIIIDNFNKLKNRQYDEWYKKYILGDSGIWVGNGINDQYLINTNCNRNDLINNCGNSFGYVIENERPILIKLLGMIDEGDENG